MCSEGRCFEGEITEAAFGAQQGTGQTRPGPASLAAPLTRLPLSAEPASAATQNCLMRGEQTSHEKHNCQAVWQRAQSERSSALALPARPRPRCLANPSVRCSSWKRWKITNVTGAQHLLEHPFRLQSEELPDTSSQICKPNVPQKGKPVTLAHSTFRSKFVYRGRKACPRCAGAAITSQPCRAIRG